MSGEINCETFSTEVNGSITYEHTFTIKVTIAKFDNTGNLIETLEGVFYKKYIMGFYKGAVGSVLVTTNGEYDVSQTIKELEDLMNE